MNFIPSRLWTVWSAGLVLVAGCAESPSSPPPPSAPPVVATPPPPPDPNAPTTAIAATQPSPPEPGATVRIRYLRETPMPPMHIRVVEADGKPPEGRAVLVDAPPPPPRHEDVPPHPPGPHHVWLPGHWRFYAGHYVWIGGRWEVPPRPRLRYVPPQWQQRGQSHWFVEGYWMAY